MTPTRVMLSSLAAAALLLANGSASAEQLQGSNRKPSAARYSKTLTFTLSTTTPSKPPKELRAKKK